MKDQTIKILFVAQSLKIGGIERALVDQVNSITSPKYTIELMLFSPSGEYLKDLKPHVKLLKSNWFLNIVGKTQAESKKHFLTFVLRSFFAMIAKTVGSRFLYGFFFKLMRKRGIYDVAISYVHDGSLKGLYYGCNSYVINKVVAKRKIAWIHSDYSVTGMNCKERNSLYPRFDYVVNVSEAMKKTFDSFRIVPEESSKVVYNRIDTERIVIKANEKLNSSLPDRFLIVSVCRIEEMKGVLQLCKIAKDLKENGCEFTWFFIGKGNQIDECKRFVTDNYLDDYIKFTGALSNPYPYIKNANVFVSGSLSETFGLSIFEAILLGTVVIAKKYDAISEVLDDNNGIVVETFDEIFNELLKLYTDSHSCIYPKRKVLPLIDYNKLNAQQFATILN